MSEVAYKLDALLAEYNTLRAEIQYRSDYQNRIFQLHITTLTFIVGAALLQSIGHWIILLIPIEASISGMWWHDQVLASSEIGNYIGKVLEAKINNLLKEEDLLLWEHKSSRVVNPSKRRFVLFQNLVFLTFGMPSVISLLIAGSLMLHEIPWVKNFAQGVGINIPSLYSSYQLVAALLTWLIGFILFVMYASFSQSKTPRIFELKPKVLASKLDISK